MLRILHLIPSISPLRGGPSQAVLSMVAALRQQGVDASILATSGYGPSFQPHSLEDRSGEKTQAMTIIEFLEGSFAKWSLLFEAHDILGLSQNRIQFLSCQSRSQSRLRHWKSQRCLLER